MFDPVPVFLRANGCFHPWLFESTCPVTLTFWLKSDQSISGRANIFDGRYLSLLCVTSKIDITPSNSLTEEHSLPQISYWPCWTGCTLLLYHTDTSSTQLKLDATCELPYQLLMIIPCLLGSDIHNPVVSNSCPFEIDYLEIIKGTRMFSWSSETIRKKLPIPLFPVNPQRPQLLI